MPALEPLTPAPQDSSLRTHTPDLNPHDASPATPESLDQLEAFLERTLRLRLLTAAADAVDALTRLLNDEKTTPTDRRRAATTILRALTASQSPSVRPTLHPTRTAPTTTPPPATPHATAQPTPQPTPRAPQPSPSQISNLKSSSPPPPHPEPAPPTTPLPQPTPRAPQPPPSQLSNLKSSSSPTPSLTAAAALLARAGLAPAHPP